MAIQTKTYKEVSFKKGVVFTKRNDRNATNINTQPAIKVFVAPSGNDEYVIPTTLLKKRGGKQSSNKDAKVVEFFKDLQSNPPLSQQEAVARAAKFGLTQSDIDAYNAKQK